MKRIVFALAFIGFCFPLGDMSARCKNATHKKARNGKKNYACKIKQKQKRRFKKNGKCKFCGCAKEDHDNK